MQQVVQTRAGNEGLAWYSIVYRHLDFQESRLIYFSGIINKLGRTDLG